MVLLTWAKIGPSPRWMVERLSAVGLRSINNVVDVTNFVMLETGQPLHFYDADRVKDARLVVRDARPDERIVTLDDTERTLTPRALVIADTSEPSETLCVAGVMGCANIARRSVIPAILALPELRLAGVASRTSDKGAEFARQFGESGSPAPHGLVAFPGDDGLQLAERAAEVIVDDDVVELVPVPHVARRVAQAPLDDVLGIGAAPAQPPFELGA
jgi:hypothetical protein